MLKSLLDEAGEGPIAYSEHLEVDGREMLARVKAMGLAGIVSKRADAPYRSGPSGDWVMTRAKAAAGKAARRTAL